MSLLALQFEFSQSVSDLLRQAAAMGLNVSLGEAWRTPEQAALDAKKGIGILHSLHEERLAIDLNLFQGTTLIADPKPYIDLGAWWTQKISPIPDAVYKYGGNFGKGDFDHYSLAPDASQG